MLKPNIIERSTHPLSLQFGHIQDHCSLFIDSRFLSRCCQLILSCPLQRRLLLTILVIQNHIQDQTLLVLLILITSRSLRLLIFLRPFLTFYTLVRLILRLGFFVRPYSWRWRYERFPSFDSVFKFNDPGRRCQLYRPGNVRISLTVPWVLRSQGRIPQPMMRVIRDHANGGQKYNLPSDKEPEQLGDSHDLYAHAQARRMLDQRSSWLHLS